MIKHAMPFLAACAVLLLSAADMSVVTPNDEGVRGADDSASIQNAVDMAAKRGTGKVVIPAWNARTGKPGWTLSRAVLLPGDMTVVIDNARLALADDVYANFFRSANTWTKKGATPEGVLRNIRIIGLGTAVLDGAKANDLNESTSCMDGRPHVRANCPIFFQNVEDFEVGNLTIENHRYWGTCFCFCRRGRIHDLRFIARFDRRNQDGINLRDGCRDITISNISGQTGDDMIALSAIDRQRDDEYNYWVEGLSPDICHVTIENVSGAAVGHPLIALRNHNGSQIHDITIDNVVDTPFEVPCAGMERRRYAIMRIGNGIYWSRRKSTLGEISRITVRNVRVGYSVQGIVVNNTLKDALFSDIRCTGPCASVVTTSGPSWGGIGATMANVTIENSSVESYVASAAVFDGSFLNPGDRIENLRLRNCALVRGGERIEYRDERIDLAGGEPAPVSAHEGVSIVQDEITLDRTGRVALKTPDSGYLKSGSFESMPFRPGANPSFAYNWTTRGGSRIVFEVSTAPDANGVPGEWSAYRAISRDDTIPLKADAWLKYRVTLFSGNAVAPQVRMIRIGRVCHSRWNLGRR